MQCPRFVNNTIHLIDLYISKNKMYIDVVPSTRNAAKRRLHWITMLILKRRQRWTMPIIITLHCFCLCHFVQCYRPLNLLDVCIIILPLMERIVLERDINPLPILTAILRYIRLTDVCPQGDWSTGNFIHLPLCLDYSSY